MQAGPRPSEEQASAPARAGNRRFARRLRHHLALGAVSAVLVSAIAESFTASPLVSVSAATAYAGLFLLAATLLIGPLNVLLGRSNPVSSDLRRDTGIWAAMLGGAHTALALLPGIRGGFGRVFAVAPDRIRLHSLAFANDAGLAGSCLLLILVLLSNDRSLRLLGRRRWKAAQRLSYALFAVVLLHTVLYQRWAQPGPVYVVLFALVVVAVPGLQLQGWLERRHRAVRR
jgi:methionine sulfoxide reductase heme-binding subunit